MDELIKQGMDLLRATDDSDPSPEDARALRQYLRDNPQLWTVAGDLVQGAAVRLINEMNAGYNVKASLKTGLNQMQQDIALPSDSPLEKLLVQNVVMCWLRLAHVEYNYTAVSTSGTVREVEYYEKRLNAAQRRFLRASQTLARIRKLSPPIQINIAQQQVNQVR